MGFDQDLNEIIAKSANINDELDELDAELTTLLLKTTEKASSNLKLKKEISEYIGSIKSSLEFIKES